MSSKSYDPPKSPLKRGTLSPVPPFFVHPRRGLGGLGGISECLTPQTVAFQTPSKIIQDNINWQEESLWFKFKAEIQTQSGNYPLSIRGTCNPVIATLSYHLIYLPDGRIYGLDLGKDHQNPNGEQVGEKHKHRWSEIYRDKDAYVPQDITASGDDPVTVWQQFCREASIRHDGVMMPIPEPQLDMFL